MVPKTVRTELEKIAWYTQGGEMKPLYISYPLITLHSMKRLFSGSYGMLIMQVKQGAGDWYFDVESMQKLSRNILEQQLKNPHYIDALYVRWKKELKKFYHAADEIIQKDLSSASTKQLKQLFAEFSALFVEEWNHFIFIDAFDPEGFADLKKHIEQGGISLTDSEITTLVAPEELSFIQEERLSMLSIALKVLREKNERILLEVQSYSDLQKDPTRKPYAVLLSKHQKKFYWYKNNYSVIQSLDADYFLHELQEALAAGKEGILQEKEKIMSLQKESKKNKREIYKKQSIPPRIKGLLYFFERLSEIRDLRKKNLLIGVTIVKKICAELARKNNVELEPLEYMSFEEMMSCTFAKSEIESLKKRISGFVWLLYNEKLYPLNDEDAQRILSYPLKQFAKEITELKGFPASPGKVTGTVKVIDKVEEFSKMNNGDILVSSMTRPEFVPVLEKAAAIVTNEGGVTCHAAVISREMKVPCIVGTKIATKVFKDNDIVEVDALQGVVRKVEHKR